MAMRPPAAPSPHARVRRCAPRYARDSQPARTSFAACSRWPLRCSRSSSESTWLGRVTVRLRVRVRARARVRVRVRLSQQRREHRELRALLGGLIRSLIRSLVNHCEYHCPVSHGARAVCALRGIGVATVWLFPKRLTADRSRQLFRNGVVVIVSATWAASGSVLSVLVNLTRRATRSTLSAASRTWKVE